MVTLKGLREFMSRVTCGPYTFDVSEAAGGFALAVDGPVENINMDLYKDTSQFILDVLFVRKRWFISKWSTDSEIVRTAYKAAEHHVNARVEAWAAGFATRCSFSDGMDDMIGKLNYKPTWRISTENRGKEVLWKLVFDAADNVGGDNVETQHCRKHIVDGDDLDELTQFPEDPTPEHLKLTLFGREIALAVAAAEHHELNEQFKFDGVDIYNPHVNLSMLAEWIRGASEEKDFYDIRPVMDKQY
jgi:hypothetical protein